MATSFLETLIEDVRIAVDDPEAGAKFTDDHILRYATNAMRRVFRDLAGISSHPCVTRLGISVVADEKVYRLPPSVGEILQMGEWDATNESWKWRTQPPSRWSSLPGIRVAAGRVVFDRNPSSAFTLSVDYVPSGDFMAHEGKSTTPTPNTLLTTFNGVDAADEATKKVRGVIDDRAGAYIGAKLRVWEETPGGTSPAIIREALVTGHAVSAAEPNRVFTIDKGWDPALGDGVEYRYEIVPIFIEGIRMAVVFATAMTLCSLGGLKDKWRGLLIEYRSTLRTERLAEAYKTPYEQHWHRDTFIGGF